MTGHGYYQWRSLPITTLRTLVLVIYLLSSIVATIFVFSSKISITHAPDLLQPKTGYEIEEVDKRLLLKLFACPKLPETGS